MVARVKHRNVSQGQSDRRWCRLVKHVLSNPLLSEVEGSFTISSCMRLASFFSLQDPLDSRLRPIGALFECPTVAVESTGPVGLIGCLVSDPTHPAEATADCKP